MGTSQRALVSLTLLIPISFTTPAKATVCTESYERLVRSTGMAVAIADRAEWGQTVSRLDNEMETSCKARGMKPLEDFFPHRMKQDDHDLQLKKLVGAKVSVIDATPPRDGKPGTVEHREGRIVAVARHIVNRGHESRTPIHDALVIEDEKGVQHLLDNSHEQDRVYIDPNDVAPVRKLASTPVSDIEAPGSGWQKVTPEAKDLLANGGAGLVGKEIVGHQYKTRGSGELVYPDQKWEVRGVIRGITSHGKWHEWTKSMPGHSSIVTGPESEVPYIAVELITPGGNIEEMSLSIDGVYHVRDLTPK